MARKRDQDDVFKPLNDSPSAETQEPQSSGRGLEIKIGLLVLVLFIGAIGYFAYLKLSPGDEAGEMVADSSRLQLDPSADKTVANQVVPAHLSADVKPELGTDDRALVMTQFNDVSKPEKQHEASAWTSSKSAADQVPQALEADTSQAYATSYGADSLPTTQQSQESTFAPMPNPGDFAAGTTAPLPSEASMASPEPTQESLYGNRVATTAPTSPMPGNLPEQLETAAPTANDQYMPGQASLPPATATYDLRAASKPDYAPLASAPPNEAPAAPSYTAPNESRVPAAPAYVAANESYAPAYVNPDQGTYTAPPAGPAPYNAPSANSLPTQDTYQPYSTGTPTRTQAGYAGLSGSGASTGTPAADTWQQPTVTPVDGKYSAQPNDNFYTISKKVYGSGAYYKALARFNADKYPTANQIRIGDVVQTPPVGTLEGRYPEMCPKPEHRDAAKRRSEALAGRSLAGRRVYVVQEGDNLFDIARFELGARAKVADLIALNRDVLGDQINYLTPGMRLVLPETNDGGSKVTQRPTNTLR